VHAATPYPRFDVNQIQVETYFSPDDGTANRLLELAASAESSISFLAFSFTSDPLAQVLLERSAAGVTVAGVFEQSQVTSNIGSEYQRLLDANLDVRLDSNPRNMHHKVLMIDERIVVFGSYNFSNNAETRNDENTIILFDPLITAQFNQEFQRIFNQARK
jgi:phosphatidylserine/phosphatidylglycerophosphate/cardiolipin synthase-like enzyme